MPIYNSISAAYIPQYPGIIGIQEKIEVAARTCYKSEGKIEYDEDGRSLTAEAFCDKILNVYKHQSCAEHGAVYLYYQTSGPELTYYDSAFMSFFETNPYSRINVHYGLANIKMYITTNYRVIIENKLEDYLQYLCNPTPYHELRHTVRVFTDRGVSAESNRHRVNSPSERSTRYVNYGNGIRVTVPTDFTMEEVQRYANRITHKGMCEYIALEDTSLWEPLDYWLYAIYATEFSYVNLLRLGWKPQQARRVLPFSTETELVVSAFESDWVKYFGQRYFGSTGTPHPDMKETCKKIMDAFMDAGIHEPVKKAIELYGDNNTIVAS